MVDHPGAPDRSKEDKKAIAEVRSDIHLARAMQSLQHHEAWQFIHETLERKLEDWKHKLVTHNDWKQQDLGQAQGTIRTLEWILKFARKKAGAIPALEERLRSAEKRAMMPLLPRINIEAT